MRTLERLESNVRSYCRNLPAVFSSARNALLEDEKGLRYIDFLAGASSLNYGHNNPLLKADLLEYLGRDGIVHSLDMATEAKLQFLESLERLVFKPRGLHYKVQFTGPTGTNAVEAALKLARRVTGRQNVVAFTNAFHGMSLGSVAATGNRYYRKAAGVALPNVSFLPYDGYFGPEVDTIDYFERLLNDTGSGLDHPAAVLVETVQGEGGINVASAAWLRRLAALCRRHDMLLIVDDIQMGCGRTGRFFSFEEAGLVPDLVILSKSLSGYGLPLSVVLIRPDLDQWQPGEHSGTFRGNNLAFVTGASALAHYWADERFALEVQRKGQRLRARLQEIAILWDDRPATVRGRGMVQALDCHSGERAQAVCRAAFERGLVIETSGPRDHVLKCIPPLTIADEELDTALDILRQSVEATATLCVA